ncbi:PDZ domain-containing protein [Chondromyces apiculatus]|uniref:PDZ domain-containing protein n=1 Tax=Chondromyces apiculatus DSM 436 TaxID=1192034 RepID=A0A017SW49_9BACT|nr:PDZ domain-containing protein [Chondromyces apiculatus]EYF00982.1 Hypothetical protein CAP_8850 [Chondromyces apiculatus DSM 436]
MVGTAKTVHVALGMMVAGGVAIAAIHTARGQESTGRRASDAQEGASAREGAQERTRSSSSLEERPSLRATAPERTQERAGRAEGETREPRQVEARKDPAAARARLKKAIASSPAASLLQKGDQVLAVDGRRVEDVEGMERHLATLSPGEPVLVEVMRGGERRFIGVQLSAAPKPKSPEARPRAEPAAAAPAAPHVVVVQPVPMAQAPAVAAMGGFFYGGSDVPLGARPPSVSSPGIAQVPGATFAPGPGSSSSYPQVPGVAQPPGFPGATTGFAPPGVFPQVPGVAQPPGFGPGSTVPGVPGRVGIESTSGAPSTAGAAGAPAAPGGGRATVGGRGGGAGSLGGAGAPRGGAARGALGGGMAGGIGR